MNIPGDINETDPQRLALKARLFEAMFGVKIDDPTIGPTDGIVVDMKILIDEVCCALALLLASHPDLASEQALAAWLDEHSGNLFRHVALIRSQRNFGVGQRLARPGNA